MSKDHDRGISASSCRPLLNVPKANSHQLTDSSAPAEANPMNAKTNASPKNTAVRLANITKTFGNHTAVNDLSLQVPAGSIYGFIGPNGSGKTTTLRMILHILHPDCGEIEVLGEQSTRAANDRIGYLPEERGLYKKMSVRRVLAYYASLKGMRGSAARGAVDSWLDTMGLQGWGDHKIEALSKGMAQKVQFISAVIARPELLILDEPFSGLDPVNMEVLRIAIIELRKKGTTIIFSTHDMTMAEKMCDFIFMIHQGRKVLDGTLESIQATYGEDTVRLRVDGGSEQLRGIGAIRSIRDMGHYQEVSHDGDPQELLCVLSAKTRIHLFEITRPSLHDIFLRIAGPAITGSHE
jgi:ABC-2 type transport system ATP-binding protein